MYVCNVTKVLQGMHPCTKYYGWVILFSQIKQENRRGEFLLHDVDFVSAIAYASKSTSQPIKAYSLDGYQR